jgi:hypothetical protein
MTAYRLYYFDRMARIVAAKDLESETDSAAIAGAARCQDGHPMELWRWDRFVESFEAKTGPDPPASAGSHAG